MNTIILQKKYLVLVETAKDMWTLFLVIVNFIISIKENAETIIETSIKIIKDNVEIVKSGVNNFSKALYSYFANLNKVYTPILIKVDSRSNNIAFKSNDDRYIYSNLLAPPCSR